MRMFLHLGVRFEDSDAPDRKAIEAVLDKSERLVSVCSELLDYLHVKARRLVVR